MRPNAAKGRARLMSLRYLLAAGAVTPEAGKLFEKLVAERSFPSNHGRQLKMHKLSGALLALGCFKDMGDRADKKSHYPLLKSSGELLKLPGLNSARLEEEERACLPFHVGHRAWMAS